MRNIPGITMKKQQGCFRIRIMDIPTVDFYFIIRDQVNVLIIQTDGCGRVANPFARKKDHFFLEYKEQGHKAKTKYQDDKNERTQHTH